MATPAGGAGMAVNPAAYWAKRKEVAAAAPPVALPMSAVALPLPVTGGGSAVAAGSSVVPTPTFNMVSYEELKAAIKAGTAIGGSTGARKITHKGLPYIYKSGTPAHVINEFAAFVLYKAAGARVPDVMLVINEDVPVTGLPGIPQGILIQYIDGISVGDIMRRKIVSRSETILLRGYLQDQFIFHALFANWDAKNSLNHIIPNIPGFGSEEENVTDSAAANTTAKVARAKAMAQAAWAAAKAKDKNEFMRMAASAKAAWANARKTVKKTTSVRPTSIDLREPYAIDLGGALFYRAMGSPKSTLEFIATEIPELQKIPESSAETSSKIYASLTNPFELERTVCRAWRKEIRAGVRVIQPDKITAMADVLVPLMKPFIPRASELPDIIRGRLTLIQNLCRDNILIESIPYYATQINRYAGAPVPVSTSPVATNEEKRQHVLALELAKKHYATVSAGLEKEATKNTLLRGKRTVTPYKEITPAALTDVLYSKNLMNGRRIRSNNSEGNLPEPPISIKPTGQAGESLLAMRADPRITTWLQEQIDFQKVLSQREQDVLAAYTSYGDRLVNNYCRGTLYPDIGNLLMEMLLGQRIPDDSPASRELLERYWNHDDTSPNSHNNNNSVALAFGIVDQINTLVRNTDLTLSNEWFSYRDEPVPVGWKPAGLVYPDGGFVKKDDFITDTGAINMLLVRLLLRDNFEYFRVRDHVLPFIEQYKQELTAVIARAPKAPVDFTVFRGIKSEKHVSDLTFQTIDFLSTAITPEPVIESFTRDINKNIGPKYHCCVYELTVRRETPCVYLENLSEFSGEFEILLPPELVVSLSSIVKIKQFIPTDEGLNAGMVMSYLLEKRLRRNYVTVIEGVVSPAPPTNIAAPRLIFERGSLEDVTLLERVAAKSWAEEPERFVSAKPRSLMKGRNRSRRLVPSWKMNRLRTQKRKTSNRL